MTEHKLTYVCIYTHKCFYTNIHSSLTCNSPKAETTYISFLLLCNRIPIILVTSNNKHLLSHSLCGSGIWEQLHQVVLVLGHLWGCSQSVKGLQSSEVWAEIGLASNMAYLWLLSEDYSFLLHRFLYRAVWVASQHGNWLPPEQVIQERGRWKSKILIKPSFQSYRPLLLLYSIK